MTIRRPVRRCCIALIGALAVLLVGCSTSSATAAAPSGIPRHKDIGELVKAVSERQKADQTAKLSLRGEVTGASTVRFTGEGVLRVLADAVSVKFTQVVTQKGAALAFRPSVRACGQRLLSSRPRQADAEERARRDEPNTPTCAWSAPYRRSP